MNTSDTNTQQDIIHEIVRKMSAAQKQVDELAVQTGLGMMESAEKYADIKLQIAARLQDAKAAFRSAGQSTRDIEELERDVETLHTDDQRTPEQRKDLLSSLLLKCEAFTDKHINIKQIPAALSHELEKLALELEIIRLRMALKKSRLKTDVADQLAETREALRAALSTAQEKLESGKAKWSDFEDEIQLAYKHLRKAIQSFH